ncbi:hypothetical protein K466DRAFT_526791 [Polyporus arcularius HHB13444]|uniref:UBC core domain-containing protein n=1 Tax=Polyporus arcularius HHB13444 TaxID=1314778 RepID=A0A5C3P5A6_9APHY|nr:hypothetical protein K466DRAFT_526791 [Polyporus arcularius HHB13444]
MPSKRTFTSMVDAGGLDVPARGRKRFQFDIRSARQAAEQGVEVQGLRLLSVAPGEEDGSFDCVIAHSEGKHVATLTFLVSEASEYPSDHTFFCSSQEDLPGYVSRVIGTIHEDGSATIQKTLMRLLEKLAKGMATSEKNSQTDDDVEDEDLEDDKNDAGAYDVDDDMGMLGAQPGSSKFDKYLLQRHFNEIVAYEYYPGIIPFGASDFALSVSLPAKSLADTISPRALMAWDKQLLSRAQHLTLLVSELRGVYPFVEHDATFTHSAHFHGVAPQFRVGLTSDYKPTQADVSEAIRKFGLKEEFNAQPPSVPIKKSDFNDDDWLEYDDQAIEDSEAAKEESVGAAEEQVAGFRSFSLSSSLESLLNGHFLRILQLRVQYKLGWAAAEALCWEVEKTQQPVGDIMRLRGEHIRREDAVDVLLSQSYILPADPLLEREPAEPINIPLVAFSYLMRRLTLCTRYCLVCHQPLQEDLGALKPYVCSSRLCTYQYYSLNRGPSLEYEICANPGAVDLLVSLAYIALAEAANDAPLPVGMGLRVPCRSAPAAKMGSDGLFDFDKLSHDNMRIATIQLIDQLPPITDIKKHLEQPRKAGRAKPRLQDIDKSVPEAAWSVLRWCVASCTAHLEELQSEEEQVKNMGPEWKQFRDSVGAPDAEAKHRRAIMQAQAESTRAREYPSLYAFHGSPTKNWHSIIRHGLWFKHIANGRSEGNGVYLASNGMISSGYCGVLTQSCWRSSVSRIASCVALTEVVNLPSKFVYNKEHFVVDKTDWIICRYLMVMGWGDGSPNVGTAAPAAMLNYFQMLDRGPQEAPEQDADDSIPYVKMDPTYSPMMGVQRIRIPEPMHALEKILAARREEFIPVNYDEDDLAIFNAVPPIQATHHAGEVGVVSIESDWQHDREWVLKAIEHIAPPPTESSIQATAALQRELKALLQEQKTAKSLKELGWYIPTDLIGDNLYQWIVELHSFDKDLPIAKEMDQRGVNSLVFEIRFPAGFPHAPPFFRILKPRFLPFSQGGGGHVTLGGAMCLDLLTADGWLLGYSISAVLLQVKLAISSLDPKPAHLAPNWDTPYGMQEAMEGFKRAANFHGWKIPQDFDRIAL